MPGKPWEAREDKALRSQTEAGRKPWEIAKDLAGPLNRTPRAIDTRVRKLMQPEDNGAIAPSEAKG